MRRYFRLTNGLFVLPLIAGLIFLSGCNNDDGNSPNQADPQLNTEDREDIADEFGRALADENEGMLKHWSEASEGGTQSTEREGEDNALDDTLIISHGGFTYTRIRNYYDVDGILSVIFEPGVTASMEQMVTIEGSRESPSGNRSISLQHYDTVMVEGLLPFETSRTVNGNGERTVEGEFQSRFRQNVKTFWANYDWSLSDLVFHVNGEEHPYPMSGEIAANVEWRSTHDNPGRSVTHEGSASFTVIFNGTRYAEIVFASGARFWIDLRDGSPMHELPGGEG